MSRYAKEFRKFGGGVILLNLLALFLPLTIFTQRGYGSTKWSQLDYLRYMLQKQIPISGDNYQEIGGNQLIFLMLCVVLPIFLSLLAGIWAMAGGPRQPVSSILAFLVLVLYLIQAVCLETLWPEGKASQIYSRGMAYIYNLVISVIASIMAILSLASTPRKTKTTDKIPNVPPEKKEVPTEKSYNVINQPTQPTQPSQPTQQPQQPKPQPPRYVPGPPRGVMVGLAGLYQGAEIPLPPGEFIKLGRANDNHLIFNGETQISRQHCMIKWDGNAKKYVIKDYSNTGSYINGSSDCIPQNLELFIEPGTVLALGNEKNAFRLE